MRRISFGTERSPTAISRRLLSMSWQKRSKRACPRSRNSGPPPNDQGRSRDAAKEVETAIHCVSNDVFAIKAGQSRLCHDRAIQGGNGVLPRVAAKQGKHHRVYSGVKAVRRGYV